MFRILPSSLTSVLCGLISCNERFWEHCDLYNLTTYFIKVFIIFLLDDEVESPIEWFLSLERKILWKIISCI